MEHHIRLAGHLVEVRHHSKKQQSLVVVDVEVEPHSRTLDPGRHGVDREHRTGEGTI